MCRIGRKVANRLDSGPLGRRDPRDFVVGCRSSDDDDSIDEVGVACSQRQGDATAGRPADTAHRPAGPPFDDSRHFVGGAVNARPLAGANRRGMAVSGSIRGHDGDPPLLRDLRIGIEGARTWSGMTEHDCAVAVVVVATWELMNRDLAASVELDSYWVAHPEIVVQIPGSRRHTYGWWGSQSPHKRPGPDAPPRRDAVLEVDGQPIRPHDPPVTDDIDPREAERIRRRDREAEAEQRDLMRPGMGKVFKQIQDAQAKAATDPPKRQRRRKPG